MSTSETPVQPQVQADLQAQELLVPEVATHVTAEIEEKRSRFIAWIGRADSEEEARDFIALARQEYPDARHHCSAFIIAVDDAQPIERSSDDGEPSGTAGKPMLDVLAGSGLSNVVAVVIRYFGGTKLGTGGLVRAYSDATNAALDKVPRYIRSNHAIRHIPVDVAEAGAIEATLRNHDVNVLDTKWEATAIIEVACAPGEVEDLEQLIAGISRGKYAGVSAGSRWVERRAGAN